MSQISVNAKENKPKSTSAGKLTAAATIFSAAKLHSLAKSNEALLLAQQKSNEILTYMDTELVKLNNATEKLESIQNASLSELKKKNERDRLRDEIEDYRYNLQELRRQQKESEESELQRCKDTVHTLNREVQLLDKVSYTNVEKLVLLDAMHNSISDFSALQFTEIADKQYLNNTQDLIEQTREQLTNELNEIERSDYEFVTTLNKKQIDEKVDKINVAQKKLRHRVNSYLNLNQLVKQNKSFDSEQLKKAKEFLAKVGVTL
jgi:hypothetical protein